MLSCWLLVRTITCLRLIFLAGGHCHLEQPTNAMSWMVPEAQDFVVQVGIFCVVMAACAYDQSWDKSWLFSSSLKDLTQMGAICKHPRGTHESAIGTRAPDGPFNNRKLPNIQKKIRRTFAKIVSPLIHPGSQELTVAESISLIPPQDLWETPWSSEDGGGIPSHPDWSRPNRTLPDVFQRLRARFFNEILEKKLHLEFLTHIDIQNPDPPFEEKTIETFRLPMTLNIMSQLGFPHARSGY